MKTREDKHESDDELHEYQLMKYDSFKQMFSDFFGLMLRGLDPKRGEKIKKWIKKNGREWTFGHLKD